MESSHRSDLPISGVVGVLGGSPEAVFAQLRLLDGPSDARPDAVEVRADLFGDPSVALEALTGLAGGLPAIFTVRLPRDGGCFRGTEPERLALYEEALSRGAAMVDVEWRSDAAVFLAAAGAPLVVSHHDFRAMPDGAELERLTERMSALGAAVLKVVPSAARQEDGAAMLRWVGSAGDAPPFRVGFAMGSAGLPSRVLSLARGAPWTYGTLGAAVAPGIPTAAELKAEYRTDSLNRSTRVFGALGLAASDLEDGVVDTSMHNTARLYNCVFKARGHNAVCLPIAVKTFDEVLAVTESLPLGGLSVTLPLQEAAARLVDERDTAVRISGRADTICIVRQDDERRLVGHAVLHGKGRAGASRKALLVEALRGIVEQLRVLTGLAVSPVEVAGYLLEGVGGNAGRDTTER